MSTSKKNQKKWLHQKESLNYLFYTIFLIAITFLCAQPTNLSFFIYCFFQASLEIIGLIFVNDLLKKRKLFFLHKAFISTLFFLLISYIINFILLTLMDTSIAYLFKTFISAGMDSFLVTLRAININASMIFIMALGFILVPALGILFYYFTNKLSEKRPLYIKNSHKLFSAIILIFIILAFDLSKIASNDFNHFNSKKKLPLRTTFLTIKKEPVKFHNLIKPLRKESDIFEKLNNQKISALKKPNIYLFIVETFRLDAITEEIAPNLYKFKNENITSAVSYANSNASHISWYSIFHSNFPYLWDIARKECKRGSIPLNILKKLDYKINVYSSSELSYYSIDELIFGKQRSLIDNFNDFSQYSEFPCERDLKTIASLKNDLLNPQKKEANIFIIFLDSPHSEYSWPKNFSPKFSPYVQKINYLNFLFTKNELPLIKNRYYNSINFIDNLFEGFVYSLKNQNLYENSLIVITGDHGEEFFEDGSLFHGTHVNRYQTSVPIFYKLNKNNPNISISSQMDIFPTILHAITDKIDFSEFFDGKSLYSNNRYNYVLSVGQSTSASRYEFKIITQDIEIIGNINDLLGKKEIFLDPIQNVTEISNNQNIADLLKKISKEN